MPPLRERPGDLELLCNALLGRIAAEAGVPAPPVPASMLDLLAREPLWGNVRELENMLHRSVALSDGGELQLDLYPDQTMPIPLQEEAMPSTNTVALPLAPLAVQGFAGGLQEHLDQHEREILVKALIESGYNRTAAATRLGISLRQIRYRIARLNIEMPNQVEIGDDPR
jgi:two-component system, NtrC family, response regulator PilR